MVEKLGLPQGKAVLKLTRGTSGASRARGKTRIKPRAAARKPSSSTCAKLTYQRLTEVAYL